MSTSFNSQICNKEGKYCLQFETTYKRLFHIMEKCAQALIDIQHMPIIDTDDVIRAKAEINGKYGVYTEDDGHENIIDAYIADGICEECDQDPTKCIHQGYCEYDRQNELREANNVTE